jgi:predicted nuclease of restriction endonuclease-like (RecB) superfamily
MRAFYVAFPKRHALRTELSWTHYRLLMRVADADVRQWYADEAAKAGWSSRQLERQISTLYHERLLASRDRESVAAEIAQSVPKSAKELSAKKSGTAQWPLSRPSGCE